MTNTAHAHEAPGRPQRYPARAARRTFAVQARGPVPVVQVWHRYTTPSCWPGWAPHLTSVRSSTPTLATGTWGTVTALRFLRARFTVTHVDTENLWWAWDVRLGPVQVHLVHRLLHGTTAVHGTLPRRGPGSTTHVEITGNPLVVVPYLPLMRRALHRLVTISHL